jgi:hypothetical protein
MVDTHLQQGSKAAQHCQLRTRWLSFTYLLPSYVLISAGKGGSWKDRSIAYYMVIVLISPHHSHPAMHNVTSLQLLRAMPQQHYHCQSPLATTTAANNQPKPIREQKGA